MEKTIYRIAGQEVSKRQFIRHLNSFHVLNVDGARACKKCPGIAYLEVRQCIYVCDQGHWESTKEMKGEIAR